MKKYYLYIYYDVDGTPIYVGIGSNSTRWRKHWKFDTRLGRVLRKRERELGISLYPEFIEADSWEDAQLGEVLYIWCFGREDLGLGPLFNLTDGGDGLTNPSFVTRSKMSDVKKNKPLSTEHRIALSKAAMESPLVQGRPERDSDTKNKISTTLSKPCTIDGLVIYPSQKALVAALGQGKSGSGHPDFRYLSGQAAKYVIDNRKTL